jgi:hypothetical protein
MQRLELVQVGEFDWAKKEGLGLDLHLRSVLPPVSSPSDIAAHLARTDPLRTSVGSPSVRLRTLEPASPATERQWWPSTRQLRTGRRRGGRRE